MEKAYAKVMGSYAAIASENRSPINELRIFTGAPVFEYKSDAYSTVTQAKVLWDHFKLGEDSKYVMTAQTYYKTATSASLGCGLKEGSNHVILAAWEMTDTSNKVWNMLLLRDPMGNGKLYN